MNQIRRNIVKKIEQYKNIALFFHELPDFDALGSCFGLQAFIQTKYPDKNVKIIGLDTLSKDNENDLFQLDRNHVPNDFLASSLGIVLDTANSKRIWSQRQNFCVELIAIDHHPKNEVIGDIEWIDPDYSATCEMLAEFVLEWDPKCVKQSTADFLYAGLLTDTFRFLYPSTRPRTYNLVASLMEHGCNRKLVHDTIYLANLKELKFRNNLFNLAHFEQKKGYAWVKIPKDFFSRYGVKKMSYVNTLGSIKGIEIWASFYYDADAKKWKASLRSAKLPINGLAKKYMGGGHSLAAGITLQKESDIAAIIKDIEQYLKNNR